MYNGIVVYLILVDCLLVVDYFIVVCCTFEEVTQFSTCSWAFGFRRRKR